MNVTKLMTYFLPLLTVLLLLVFFLGLPKLKSCSLPRTGKARIRSRRLGRDDVLPILLITLLYAVTAFYRLGSDLAPQSFVVMDHKTAEYVLPEGAVPQQLLFYAGPGYGTYDIDWSEDGETYDTAATFEHNYVSVFKWNSVTTDSWIKHPRYVRITNTYGETRLGEIALLDGEGRVIPVTCSIPELSDEADTVPETPGFQNSSYFDEIYHARTAWEHLNDVRPYETTHPPLGKEIIGVGVALFGMTPFGWRFSGTLFGVLMLPLLYIFLKKLFGGRAVPSMGTLLFATDFMHYVQTRIATIDTYAVFFILLMYLFLYLWISEDKLWALALCGVSFGLGAASKWTCLYAGAGLGILWLAHWIRRWLKERKEPRPEPEDPAPERAPSPLLAKLRSRVAGAIPRASSNRYSRGSHAKPAQPARTPERKPRRGMPPLLREFLLNVGFCLIFFVLIPGLIYYLSYIPIGRYEGLKLFTREYWAMVKQNQVGMFTYHSKSVLGATHPYSSRWYQWLVNWRPILYVLEYPQEGAKISIAAFLNPVLCWGGLLSLPVLGWTAIGRKDRRAAFILVGYLSQLLPWVPVARLTFAYHYFPSALFLCLSLSYVLALLRENRKDWGLPAVMLVGGSAVLFLLFFPVLNGLEMRSELASALLRWLPAWPL